mmetsp:Transcript_19239/g.66716  ORF Transcript_19239/g.66716 Transcript_19239/m.66716 type:complete len:282 (+) Transcript_19239:55-900(+)
MGKKSKDHGKKALRVAREEKRRAIFARLAPCNALDDCGSSCLAPPLLAFEGLALRFAAARDVDASTRDALFALLEANMRAHYEASDWGWDEREKRGDLSSADARLLVAEDAAGAGADFEASGNSELLAQLLAKEEDRAAEVSAQVEDLRERDAYVREAGVEAARVPDAVANRMVLRMALFGGLPAFGGVGLFVWFYFAATRDDNVFQPTAVATATTVPWVIGLLGIGYGALSASWDEEEDGSALGFKEIKLNVGRLLDGVSRSAKDAQLREKVDRDEKRRR